jgi:polyketide cyclase/dehydrase/lipid transport protein
MIEDNELEIVELDPPTVFGIRTTSGPTPFVYRYGLTDEGGATLVELDATVDLGARASVVAPLAARAVKRGIDTNLATLRATLER